MGPFFLLILGALPCRSEAKSFSWDQPWRSLPQLLEILKSVPEGRAIVARAQRKTPSFARHVRRGMASFTESTFSRSYSLLDGSERITLHHEVTLDSRLSVADAVVDLAHELVHISEKEMLDPYQEGFELREFVRKGIEGEGGELAALEVECHVAWALRKAYPGYPEHALCEPYRGSGNRFQREAARRDYYALGSWLSQVGTDLRTAIPELTDRSVMFTSSYAGKPYPLALVEEYEATRRAACENNRRKYRLIASQSVTPAGSSRVPASLRSLGKEKQKLKAYDRLRCRSSKDL